MDFVLPQGLALVFKATRDLIAKVVEGFFYN